MTQFDPNILECTTGLSIPWIHLGLPKVSYQAVDYLDVPLGLLGSLVNGSMAYNLLINGVYCGYNPLTNLLLTSWDILVKTQPLNDKNSQDLSDSELFTDSLFQFLGLTFLAPKKKDDFFFAPKNGVWGVWGEDLPTKVGYGPLLGLTFLRARMSLDSAELAMTLLRFRADVTLDVDSPGVGDWSNTMGASWEGMMGASWEGMEQVGRGWWWWFFETSHYSPVQGSLLVPTLLYMRCPWTRM